MKVVVRTNVKNIVRVFDSVDSYAVGIERHYRDTVMNVVYAGTTAFYVEEEELKNMQTLLSGETIAWIDDDLLQVRVEEKMMAVTIWDNQIVGIDEEDRIVLEKNFSKNIYLVNKDNIKFKKWVALNERAVYSIVLYNNVAAVRA